MARMLGPQILTSADGSLVMDPQTERTVVMSPEALRHHRALADQPILSTHKEGRVSGVLKPLAMATLCALGAGAATWVVATWLIT